MLSGVLFFVLQFRALFSCAPDHGDGRDSYSGEFLTDTLKASPTVSFAAVVRDFQSSHPDFEREDSKNLHWITKNLVKKRLGKDGKPVFNEGPTITNRASFNQWYNDVPGVNVRVPITLDVDRTKLNTLVLDRPKFFPIDGQGFKDITQGHNYFFTLEMHHRFLYKGNQTSKFRGDGDLWVFINGSLVLDLGGVHTPIEQEIPLDKLKLHQGQFASLDIFYAERHTVMPSFRIETTLDLEQPCEASTTRTSAVNTALLAVYVGNVVLIVFVGCRCPKMRSFSCLVSFWLNDLMAVLNAVVLINDVLNENMPNPDGDWSTRTWLYWYLGVMIIGFVLYDLPMWVATCCCGPLGFAVLAAILGSIQGTLGIVGAEEVTVNGYHVIHVCLLVWIMDFVKHIIKWNIWQKVKQCWSQCCCECWVCIPEKMSLYRPLVTELARVLPEEAHEELCGGSEYQGLPHSIALRDASHKR